MLVKGSFEDFIYIIIGVIWIAFSIYKGAAKNKARKNQPSPPQTEEQESTSIFENFLNNLIKEEEKEPYEPVELRKEETVEVKPAPESSDKIFSYDDLVEESNYFHESNVYEEKADKKASLKEELKTHLKDSKTKPRFDLRKAVIYSEILNRRYF